MKLAILLLAAVLVGCAAAQPAVEVSTPRSVVIRARVMADAHALAQTECSKYRRHARLAGPGNLNSWAFDCVE